MWLGQGKWKKKQINLYETLESPLEKKMLWLPHSGKLHNVFYLHGHRNIQQESRFHHFQYHQFLQQYHELKLSVQCLPQYWNQPSLRGENRESFCKCQKPLRGILWWGLQLLSLGRRDSRIHGGSEESVAPRLKTCLCSMQRFYQEHTCLQAASLGDLLQKGATRPGTEGLPCPLAVPLNDCFNKKVPWQSVLAASLETSQQ